MYIKKGNSKQLPWPSRRRNGAMPSDRSKTLNLSMTQSISTSNTEVMLPFSEQQQKVGTVLPLMWQNGPCGYCLPRPPVLLRMSSSPPIHVADALNPNTHALLITWAAKIMAHMTGSSVAAVKPKTVTCDSFLAALICGRPCASHKNFSTPSHVPVLCCWCVWSFLINKNEFIWALH